jgi:hypothetical protein
MKSIKEQNSHFAKLACTPSLWFHLAHRLRTTANFILPQINALWEQIESTQNLDQNIEDSKLTDVTSYLSVFMMLSAYAIENMMKGYLTKIYQNELLKLTTEGGKIPKMLKTHQLIDLADRCHLQLEEHERTLLRRLTSHAVWEGRYPLTESASSFFSVIGSDGIPQTDHMWSSTDADQIVHLTNHIAKALDI